YDELPALLDIRAALAAGSYVVPSRALVRGTPATVLAAAPHRLKGTVVIGGQDHFYLEGQIAIAIPQEDGAMLLYSSTQHPTEVQHIVPHRPGKRSRRLSSRQRLLPRARRDHLTPLPDPYRIQHRLPRFRWPAGHDGHRKDRR